MAAKRKFTVTRQIIVHLPPDNEPRVTEATNEVEADKFEIVDGAATFAIDGFTILALAPGTWLRVEIVPLSAANPIGRR